MGGEDVEDEELLWTQPVVATESAAGSASSDDDEDDAATTREPARKKAKTPQQVLLQSGRNLSEQTTKEQAVFLNTALQHYRLLRGHHDETTPPLPAVLPHFLIPPSQGTLLERIRSAISMQQIKKQWKHKSCPCVLIVCLSARRSVAVLKELASLQLRAFKLFPKSGSIAEHTSMLQSVAPCPLAVGTPHRLLALQSVLRLDHTRLVVLDGCCSQKQYTVCTLPDTAPHCMEWLERVVLPQVVKKKKTGEPSCNIAFL